MKRAACKHAAPFLTLATSARNAAPYNSVCFAPTPYGVHREDEVHSGSIAAICGHLTDDGRLGGDSSFRCHHDSCHFTWPHTHLGRLSNREVTVVHLRFRWDRDHQLGVNRTETVGHTNPEFDGTVRRVRKERCPVGATTLRGVARLLSQDLNPEKSIFSPFVGCACCRKEAHRSDEDYWGQFFEHVHLGVSSIARG